MLIVMFIIAALGWALYYYQYCKALPPVDWETYSPPEEMYRGPNADATYYKVILGGRGSLFTDEEVVESRHRYLKYVGKPN